MCVSVEIAFGKFGSPKSGTALIVVNSTGKSPRSLSQKKDRHGASNARINAAA
jgi:hypothetical protein